MFKLIKQFFCVHRFKHIGTLCGCENCFECEKCGKRITTFYRSDLERLWKTHQIELDFLKKVDPLKVRERKF